MYIKKKTVNEESNLHIIFCLYIKHILNIAFNKLHNNYRCS